MPSIADILKARAQPAATPADAQATPTASAPATAIPANASLSVADKDTQRQLADKMKKLQRKSKEQEAGKQAAALGIPTINLTGFPITSDALTQLPEERARAMQAIVFFFDGAELRLGAVHAENPAISELAFELGERCKAHTAIYAISQESFDAAAKLYAALPKIKAALKGVEITEDDLGKYAQQVSSLDQIANALKTANVTDILTIAIAASISLESSDIHIEAEEKGIAIRFRVDGLLQDVAILEPEQWKKLVNRIKLIGGLKLNVTNRAQDGRFTIFQKKKKIDVRVSTIPTAFGESIVLRLLNPDAVGLEFADLGFRPAALARITREIDRPNGMIVTTGPTGSGKTTTLYAILRRINRPDVKIITLEDPIEYKLEGINQSQIDAGREYTFAKGLRSILRQDPDIIMVGEIRDQETAEITIQAALTGHLLLSTVHTNDAASAIPRFLSMGAAPHLLAPALNAIMSQRLVRKACTACSQPRTVTDLERTAITAAFADLPASSGEKMPDIAQAKFVTAKGCATCGMTGYRGRIGVYEILLKDAAVEKAILSGTISEYALRDIAREQGMTTMLHDALLKASEGVTTLEEIQRILGWSWEGAAAKVTNEDHLVPSEEDASGSAVSSARTDEPKEAGA